MTLDEMAKTLGVSKSTVSRALSGKGRIGNETAEKIKKFALENSYAKLETAPVLDGGFKDDTQTKNIGVVLPADVYASGGTYFEECILGICETAAYFDYDVLITTSTMNDINGIKTMVEKKKVDAIILTRAFEDDKAIKYLADAGFPVGLTGIIENKDVIQVDIDNEGAAENMTSLLIARGYRKFALIIDSMDYRVNKSRYNGFYQALLKNGISPEKQLICSNPIKADVESAVIGEIMAQKVDCIICGDDIICTRIMSKLQSEGYKIPKDISIASLYNSSNLDCFSPAVTAMNVSARQVGNTICKQMINFLNGREYELRTIMDYEILLRKSANGLNPNRK